MGKTMYPKNTEACIILDENRLSEQSPMQWACEEEEGTSAVLRVPPAEESPKDFARRGGAAERARLRRKAETSDTELAPTKVKLERAQGECLGIRSRRRT